MIAAVRSSLRASALVLAIALGCLPAQVLAASRTAPAARSGMVVSAEPIASQVGLDVLIDGGNAVDATIATAFALAVVFPKAGNIGGGGFLLYRDASTGTADIVDFRETAPAGATPTMYLGPDRNPVPGLSTDGYLSIAIPGTVAGLAAAHERYGLLPWHRLLRPAIQLARYGFPVSEALARSIEKAAPVLGRYPSAAAVFLPGGKPPAVGSIFKQRELARTLSRISRYGADGFYRGSVAEAIESDVRAHGGILTREDLAGYRVRIRRPLEGTYGEYRLLVVPPPSSGGALLLEILNMLEPYQISRFGPLSSRTVHLMTEVERRAFADRAAFFGDPDFTDVPVEGLISKQYALSRTSDISLDRAGVSADVKAGEPQAKRVPHLSSWPAESPDTTHLAVVDRWRNVAALTYTLNDSYGSKTIAAGTGVLLNDEMDDFSSKPGTPNLYGLVGDKANEIRPGKRPVSSMCPTIVLKNGRPFLVLGTPGGSTIITSVAQVLLNVVDHGMPLQEAVDAPRVHHQWLPDRIQIEDRALAQDVRAALDRLGHTIAVREPIGDFQALHIDPIRGIIEGASDPRGCGEPRGY